MNLKTIPMAIVSLAICVLIVVNLCVPIMSPNSDDSDWMYDDYRVIENVESVDGNLEIVTVGGTDYIHAKGVGSGTITYSNGDVESITVDKAILDVFFLYGQSNASYRNGDITQVTDKPPIGTTYYFGYEDAYGPPKSLNSTGFDVSLCDMYTLYDDTGTLRVGGILPSFSYNYYEITGHKLYLIDGAIGGKSITTFDPPSGQLWTYGDSILTAGLGELDSDLYDYSCKYYMWIQGESDTNMNINTYKTRFMEMHTALLSGDMAGVHFQKCFMSKVREKNGVNSSAAQLQLADEHPNTIEIVSTDADSFTVENGLMGSDDLHYSQKGNNIIGERFGVAIGETVNPSYKYDDAVNNIISIVPIILIVSLVIASVSIFFVKRRG